MAQSAQTYHEDENLYGGYQYITLKEVVDEMMLETTDTSSHLSNTSRSKIVTEAKNGVRELSRSVKKSILAFEITVSPTLYMPLPQDYTAWMSVSVVGDDFKLCPLDINKKMSTAKGLLQDNDYKLLFDSDGEILTADSSNIYNKKFKKYEFSGITGDKFLDTSNLSGSGDFNIDEERGLISFSSNMVDREVVIHYISDGMQMKDLKDSEVKIHKDLKELLMEYIYMKCISRRRSDSVPANEKARVKNSYLALLHKAKIDRAQFSIEEIVRGKRTGSKLL